ncbi:MAG: biotin/lipoyl-containing protein [Deltaproteobacteria bacterium]|nr:biotin/lipoyl-containing protein [Deltaproteobacteria bacterium]
MHSTYQLGARHLHVGLRREGAGRFEATTDSGVQQVDAALVDGHTVQLCIGDAVHVAHVVRVGAVAHVWLAGRAYVLEPERATSSSHAVLAPPQIVAPMPGKVLEVLVSPGQQVAEGDGLVILEAMKMEHRITAAAAATVRAVHASGGQMVDGGAVLIELEYAGDD